MSTPLDAPRISREEINRYGATFLRRVVGRTMIVASDPETRNATLDFLTQVFEAEAVVVVRDDPAVVMDDPERRREFSQDLFSRAARGGGPTFIYVTTDIEFLHRRQAHPLIERATFYDMRAHMA